MVLAFNQDECDISDRTRTRCCYPFYSLPELYLYRSRGRGNGITMYRELGFHFGLDFVYIGECGGHSLDLGLDYLLFIVYIAHIN